MILVSGVGTGLVVLQLRGELLADFPSHERFAGVRAVALLPLVLPLGDPLLGGDPSVLPRVASNRTFATGYDLFGIPVHDVWMVTKPL
jgi:hypothetical protein